ncbi:DUF6998 domain-containing protein [Vibrio cyclitrophicus]|uniref:DUF6998 domain-containing protein n=1 Tax=Vibrio cyclitrophicus TaxID=47951 RepID=UPI0021C2CAC7|nr:hypothetical protein [Vibrio cyclitrophicus]
MEIHHAVKEMLKIVEALQKQYSQKKFTLDGRLVGDLGEILVEKDYDLELYPGLEKHHDGKTPDGRKVQIKTTMKNSLTFPVDHTPEYYIGIKILPDGSYYEVFNGPGSVAGKAVKNRKPTKNNLHSITLSALEKLSKSVSTQDRIQRKTKPEYK